MKSFIAWLRTPETILRAAINIMIIYTVHNAYILSKLEVMDLSFDFYYNGISYHITLFHWLFSIVAAVFTEFVVLVLFINGERGFARFYAIATFGLNTFYYIYFKEDISTPMMVVAVFVSSIHLAAIWFLGELFYELKFEAKAQQQVRNMQVVRNNTAPVKEPIKGDLIPGITEESNLVHIEEAQEGKVICPHCYDKFKNKFSLNRHILRKHSEMLQPAI